MTDDELNWIKELKERVGDSAIGISFTDTERRLRRLEERVERLEKKVNKGAPRVRHPESA